MPRELIASAYAQAERSDPALRAAALLHIARVESALDRDAALRTLDKALQAIAELPPPDREYFQEHADNVTAAIAPERIQPPPPSVGAFADIRANHIGNIMLEHGHVAEAAGFVMQCENGPGFPFGLVGTLLARIPDEEPRRALLRRTVEAWRHSHDWTFPSLLQTHWSLLPPDEALALIREFVSATFADPDTPVQCSYDPESSVTITSGRAHNLFQVFHVLRHLDPALADSLVAQNEQLAAAIRRYPNGMETVMEEAQARAAACAASGGGGGGGYFMMGSDRDFPYMRTLMDAERGAGFDAPLEHALERYAEDSNAENPNRVAREFWPSASMFRQVLYTAGKQLGRDAVPLLDRIPDADLRLFAQIELAAALAGLPQFRGVQREYRPRMSAATAPPEISYEIEDTADRDTGGPQIRCPKCGWRPRPEDRWFCNCGHSWNTFDTGGVCPECLYQWKETACPHCGEWSPHSDWYTTE